MAVSLNALAVYSRDRGEVAAGQCAFEEGLAVCRELGDLKAAARALSNLASVVRLQGDFARARSLYQECEAQLCRTGRPGRHSVVTRLPGRCGPRAGRNGNGPCSCTSRAWPFPRPETIRGASPARWLIWETWRSKGTIRRGLRELYGESLQIFKDSNRNVEWRVYWNVLRAQRRPEGIGRNVVAPGGRGGGASRNP